jgi:uncharacterized membrane protein YqaE (UPF0057 family)
LPRFAVKSGNRRLRAAEDTWPRQSYRAAGGQPSTAEVKDEEAEMKALRYFFCVVLPPVAVLMTGRVASFFLSLILTLLGWIPGVIHACLVVNDYHAEQRAAGH